jgi:hypothetical protein
VLAPVLHLGTPAAVPQGTHHHADLDEVLEVATGVTLELPRRSASSLADHTPGGLPQLGDRLVQPFGGQALRKAGRAAVGEVHVEQDEVDGRASTQRSVSQSHFHVICDIRTTRDWRMRHSK